MTSNLINTSNLGSESQEIVDALLYLGTLGYNFPVSSGASIAQAKVIDSTNANNVYVGLAVVGSSQAGAVWQIQKIVTAGTIITILYANGNAGYTNIWNNRAGLTYS